MDYVAHQAPLCMGFSRQEYWSGLPFPSPGDLPDSGIEPGSPALQADSLPTELPGNSPPWNMGSLHFEARDGYFNRVVLNVQGKSFFLQSAVLYVNREYQRTTLANYLCDLWHRHITLLKMSKTARTLALGAASGLWLGCIGQSTVGDFSGKTHVWLAGFSLSPHL